MFNPDRPIQFDELVKVTLPNDVDAYTSKAKGSIADLAPDVRAYIYELATRTLFPRDVSSIVADLKAMPTVNDAWDGGNYVTVHQADGIKCVLGYGATGGGYAATEF